MSDLTEAHCAPAAYLTLRAVACSVLRNTWNVPPGLGVGAFQDEDQMAEECGQIQSQVSLLILRALLRAGLEPMTGCGFCRTKETVVIFVEATD